MKILVTAGTGTIGSRVIEILKKQNVGEVYQATRIPEGLGQIALDLSSEDSIHKALVGMEKVILITPASQTEHEDGIRFVRAAGHAGVKHIVFMSIHQVEKAPNIPHFAAKLAIQNELMKSSMKWTTVAPNNFYQNDLWFKSSLLENGIYPQPYGSVGLSRVDADDIADALVNSLMRMDLAGQVFPLAGPEVLTVQDVCATYSNYLNKEIRYGGDDLKAWFDFNRAFLPEWLLKDWLAMYDFFQKKGLKATVADLLQQEKILGHPPRQFETFVKETVQKWKSFN
jgi:uncharacterized protein YbjT (DUF2867 family)